MEIGIIVHSLTGNTLSVAERLQERLAADGHDVEIEQLKTIGEEKTNENNSANITLKSYPDPQAHDLLIIAGPVRGASASPVLKHYFSRVGQFENKPMLLFVTEFFPFPWMGGKNALKQMTALCDEHGADVITAKGRSRICCSSSAIWQRGWTKKSNSCAAQDIRKGASRDDYHLQSRGTEVANQGVAGE